MRYIVFGANTKTLKGRKGKKYQIFPWRCFSIVLQQRTVDIQATSDEEAQVPKRAVRISRHGDRGTDN